MGIFFLVAVLVHSFQDVSFGTRRFSRLEVFLVGHGDIVDHIISFEVHIPDSLFHDDGQFVGKGWVIGFYGRVGQGQQMAVTILMLEAFACQRGSSGGSTDHKSACPDISGRPDQIADPLESEHGIEDEEGNAVHSVGGIAGSGSDERRHGA